jgi:hypothetical protein
MSKYFNRIQSEFENILLELSKNPKTTYNDAYKKAEKYVEDFSKKKNVNEIEKSELLELCNDLILDWYPDTSYLGSVATL